MSLKSKR